tara:strand:- start:17058 stop:18089 length:1032 start_codon:yes stop_codon:yes gene_type:complete
VIISRYISNEIIINICWVSLVLFGLVLFSRFNIFLSQAEVGKISPENIFIALLLFSPELLNLVFPLSVFLATGFVLTPIFKNHSTIFDSGSFGSFRLVWSQKWLILGIFSISLFLSTFLSPFFTSKAEDLIDKDNSVTSKIAFPSGLVPLQPDTFNAFGIRDGNTYKDLLFFFDSNSIDSFIYAESATIRGDKEDISLVFTSGFLYDDTRKAMSRFNDEASINVENFTSPEYISTLTLLKNDDIESLRELYKRISIPLFCLVSLIFSLVFSSYAAFFGRERTYFFLAIINIFYLLLTISALNSSAANPTSLTISFFWMHDLFLILALLLIAKPIKRIFGYEGL